MCSKPSWGLGFWWCWVLWGCFWWWCWVGVGCGGGFWVVVLGVLGFVFVFVVVCVCGCCCWGCWLGLGGWWFGGGLVGVVFGLWLCLV
ncbi:hypothetical protein [Pseudomonas syringae group genomosp. 7]|uniref:hypothetical protein n=1 Tax=Pseudomonas syringae group genomosp. 7 TaxID=251699 RepID=UPI00376F618F